jgi:hypothetical protein
MQGGRTAYGLPLFSGFRLHEEEEKLACESLEPSSQIKPQLVSSTLFISPDFIDFIVGLIEVDPLVWY